MPSGGTFGVSARFQARTRGEVEAFFDGAELLDPGVVCLPRWRPDLGHETPPDDHVNTYGGVARLRRGPRPAAP